MYNARISVLFFLFPILTLSSLFGQSGLQMKLQLLPDGESWGVYVKPEGVTPSESTVTAGGQVTVIMPNGFQWNNLQSFGGQWSNDNTVFDPPELPGRQVTSFGLIQAEPLYPIHIQAGEETLLFTFSGPTCPDTMYLIDCVTAVSSGPVPDVCPFCPEYDDGNYPDNCHESNPGNDLGVLDFGLSPPQNYNYEGNYALSAWSCHDCDDDGILNALEDTNGDGEWTPGVDLSEICSRGDFVKIKLQYNSAEKSWGIFMTPDEEFEPTSESELVSGKLSLLSSLDFFPSDILSLTGGEWTLGSSVVDSPNHPGQNIFTFELETNGVLFDMHSGEEVKLFEFSNSFGICPSSLSLPENPLSNLVEAIEIAGTSNEGNEEVHFGFSEIYGPNAWECELIIGGGLGLDSLVQGNGTNIFFKGNTNNKRPILTPNPVTDHLTIKFPPVDSEQPTKVHLIGVHGQTMRQEVYPGRDGLQLDMSHLPPGIYFLSVEINNTITYREKVMKK